MDGLSGYVDDKDSGCEVGSELQRSAPPGAVTPPPPPSSREVQPSTLPCAVLAAAVIIATGAAVAGIGSDIGSGISQQPPNMKRSVQMPPGWPPFLTHSQTNIQTPRRPERPETHGEGRI